MRQRGRNKEEGKKKDWKKGGRQGGRKTFLYVFQQNKTNKKEDTGLLGIVDSTPQRRKGTSLVPSSVSFLLSRVM